MQDNNMSSVRHLSPGTTLNNGKYTIEKKIGEGGFGITYRAIQSGLGRIVCIKEYFLSGYCMRNTNMKTITLQGVDDEMFMKYRKAFVKEAQLLAGLRHPGIVEVIDIFDENNTSYMVMPFVEGNTLQSIVEKNGPLQYPEAVNYIAQVADAVGYIHERNILHRDIKPENIIITGEHRAILIDFGSAREFVNDKTQAQTSILTHGYAPTEQYSKTSRKGSYTDIYALGATLYFVLTGKVPMDAAARMTDEMPAPKQFNLSIPDEANRTIMKAMQMKAADRHQSMSEFMDDLRNIKPSTATRATKIKGASAGSSQKTMMQPQESKKSHAGMIIAICAGAAVLIGLIVFLLLQNGGGSSSGHHKKKAKTEQDDTIKGENKSEDTDNTVELIAQNERPYFSLGDYERVEFAPGNLQYQPSSGKWRFAPYQYSYIGYDNQYISDSYSGWIDLFGWGTGSNPTRNTNNDYGDYEYFDDWGSEGIGGDWRTPSKDEWNYLFNRRDNASQKWWYATVNGVAGVIILPDNWSLDGYNYRYSSYDLTNWNNMEHSGAIFLPAAGWRKVTSMNSVGTDGDYWSSTKHSSGRAYNLDFNSRGVTASDNSPATHAFAVRLIRSI